MYLRRRFHEGNQLLLSLPHVALCSVGRCSLVSLKVYITLHAYVQKQGEYHLFHIKCSLNQWVIGLHTSYSFKQQEAWDIFHNNCGLLEPTKKVKNCSHWVETAIQMCFSTS